jgi:hypothetical protein
VEAMPRGLKANAAPEKRLVPPLWQAGSPASASGRRTPHRRPASTTAAVDASVSILMVRA